MHHLLDKARKIRLVIFDVDGVLTDGRLFLGDNGQEYKAFHSRDGHGMTLLLQTGMHIGVISGRCSNVVRLRMNGLGVRHVYQGCRDKLPAYEEMRVELNLPDHAVAYVGDDVVDLPVMRRVGLAIAVRDAHPLVCLHAHWCTRQGGGQGAVREICEWLMQAQGTLDAALATYLGH